MRAPLCIQLQESSMVPSLGAVLVPLEDQTTLQVPSCLMTDWWKSGCMNTSFHAQTSQDRKKPLKRPLTEMRANYPHNQNEKHPLSLPTNGYVSPFHTTICFLHACTPARLHACTPYARTPARLHSYTRSGNKQTVGYQIQKNISFKKTFGVLKRWETIRAVEQVNPTAQNTLHLYTSFVLFITDGGFSHGKYDSYSWCLS